MHGMALAIHRLWNNLGFRMNKYLAWFITFNFINVAWVFFRAKEFDDAIKVLSGMVGNSGVVLQQKYLAKYAFLSDLSIEAGKVTQHIGGGTDVLFYLSIAFLIILLLKNAMYFYKNFKINLLSICITITLIITVFSHFSNISEFLYFNF